MIPPFALVLTAAGSSTRFSKNQKEAVKKEYLRIDGHTVLSSALRPFYSVPGLRAVVVTCPKGAEDETVVALEDLVDISSIPRRSNTCPEDNGCCEETRKRWPHC